MDKGGDPIRGLAAALLMAAGLVALPLAGTAAAAVSCSFDDATDTLTVSLGAAGDSGSIVRAGNQIDVGVACTNGPATLY